MSDTLILEFNGWCLIRLPTDPDPPDEPRGVSGYTFAFGDEPDLDRVIHLHVPRGFEPRSHGPDIGVFVRRATRYSTSGQTDIPALLNAPVELLDNPELENRNWVLTLPGEEPIVPFHLQITGDGIGLRRNAPIDPEHPDKPVWEIDQKLIKAHGARGLEFEPDTIGRATNIWDSVQVAVDRRKKLEKDLEHLKKSGGDPTKIAILESRIYQLDIGINDPSDRRTAARNFVERFGFPMQGEAEIQGDQEKTVGGKLATKVPWSINFWIGAWDPDILCAFMQGSLEIPYEKPPPPKRRRSSNVY